MTREDAKELVKEISSNFVLREELWKAMISDRRNIKALVEELNEYVRDGGRLPTS